VYIDNVDDYIEIEIDRIRGYFDDLQFDEDADDYDEKINAHICETLLPKIEPITNGQFKNTSLENKYKTLNQKTEQDHI